MSFASLVHATKALLLCDRFLGTLESPRTGVSIADALVISGWAFSLRAPVERVEAFLDAVSVGPLEYGLERPDVARVFPRLDVVRSGYEARIPLERSIRGSHTLVVRVTDQRGHVKEYRRPVAIRTAVRPRGGARVGSLAVEIEQAIWSESTLAVEGWAVWSGAALPLTAHVGLGGKDVGRWRVRFSRPDIAERFTDEPGAVHSGFRLSVALPRSTESALDDTEAELRIDLFDAEGRRGRRSTMIRRDVQADRAADVWRQLEEVIEGYESGHARLPAVLDWNAGLDAARSARCLVFSPPVSNSRPVLPYADRSIDIVVVVRRSEEYVNEAIRVAAAAVVVVDGGQIETIWSAGVQRPPPPRVSIIIPVHGQVQHTEACLQQLQATLPGGFLGEILIVDDASIDGTADALANWAVRDRRITVLTNDCNLGFLESCNRAARAADGDVLVFLNNDTLPQPGWLPPLLDSLRDPGAGAAGAKLVYPDGSLQEAGGVIFGDASGWNFGKGDPDPDAPIFNYVREVDYCSGAALATPRRLFLSLGSFDARFSPGYYEDADYCFRLRAQGYRVLYQPASAVVHVEGATSGVDEHVGIKSAQVANRIVFAEKWSDALSARPAPPERLDRTALYRHAVRDRGVRRALVWAPRLPEHDRESGSRRVYDTIRYLIEAGWAVTFIAESATGGERYVSMLEQMGVTVYAGRDTCWAGSEYLPDPTELLTFGAFDLAILHFWWIAERHLQSFRRHSPSTRVIVDSVDLAFLRRTRSKYRERPDSGDVLNQDDATAMMRELNVYAAADAVLTVSAKEAAFINDLFADRERAHVVPDAEELRQSPVDFGERGGLLFLGNFRHTPNVEALAYLAREIVPRLRADLLARHPISVVGNDLTESLVDRCGARADSIRPVGWVPSVEAYLERARVTLVPLCHGAGTKRKLVQAAMTGTPSVSTSVGIEGLNLSDGEHVIVADSPAAFAEGIDKLVDDPVLWRRLALAGREAVLRTHGREIVGARFNAVIERITERPARS